MVAEAGHHRQPHPGKLPGDGPHGVQGLLPGEHLLGGVREIVPEMRKLGCGEKMSRGLFTLSKQ